MNRLNDEQLKEVAPAIFAETPKSNVSEKYVYVPTHEIISNFRELGWHPIEAKQVASKTNLIYAKHRVKLTYETDEYDRNGVSPQILLYNSHDRTSRAILGVGFIRWICENGLIVATGPYESISTKHIGFKYNDLKLEIEMILDKFDGVFKHIDECKEIELDKKEKEFFAWSAIYSRWLGNPPNVKADTVLTPRRVEDEGDSLWNVFNVIQENLMKGGLSYIAHSGRQLVTQSIESLIGDNRINRELWIMLEAVKTSKIGLK